MDIKWNVRLREKRIQQNLTLKQVSEINDYGLSQKSLIKYEKGDVAPRIDILENLCSIYKCDINYILYGSENTNIIIDKNDYMITIWYLLLIKKIDFDGDHLIINDKQLKKNINYLNIYHKNVDICSLKDIYRLLDGIKKMRNSD